MDGSPYEGPPVHPPFRTDSGHLSLSAIQLLRTAGESVG